MQDKSRTPGDIARLALLVFGVIAAAVTVIAVTESYSNLLAFARAYGLSGWRAAIAPAAADSFIIMGELLLFAAILLRWGKVPHALGAGMAVWGFLLSVGGNVWHAAAAAPVDRAVAAIWPVTATAGLAGALIIVRQIMNTPGAPVSPPSGSTGTGLPPVPDREEPRRARSSRAAVRPPVPAASASEAAMKAALVAEGLPLPPYRSWSFEKTGMYRSAGSKRAYDAARTELAGMNGGSHG
jgi:hypothetical protein